MALPSPISFLLSAVVVIVGCAADDGDRSRSARGDTLDAVAPWEYERMYWQVRTVLGDRVRDSYLGTDTMRVLAWRDVVRRSILDGVVRQRQALVWYAYADGERRRIWALTFVVQERDTQGRPGRWRAPWNDKRLYGDSLVLLLALSPHFSPQGDAFDRYTCLFDRRPGTADIRALLDEAMDDRSHVYGKGGGNHVSAVDRTVLDGEVRRRTWNAVIGEDPPHGFLRFVSSTIR